MRIIRRGDNASGGESEDENENDRKRQKMSASEHQQRRASRREANVDDELAKARARAARLKEAQQKASSQKALAQSSSSTVRTNGPSESHASTSQSTALSGACKKLSELDKQHKAGAAMSESSMSKPGTTRAPLHKSNVNVSVSAAVESPLASTSRQPSAIEEQETPKHAPFTFRKPTVIKGPSQKEYSVYFVEPRFENEATTTQSVGNGSNARALMNRSMNLSDTPAPREWSPPFQNSTSLGYDDSGKASYRKDRSSCATPQRQYKGRGAGRGFWRGQRGPMKQAAVTTRRGATRQALLDLRPISDENLPYNQSWSSPRATNAHHHTSPSRSFEGYSQSSTPSRYHPTAQQAVPHGPPRNFHRSSSVSMRDVDSRSTYSNIGMRNQLPRSSEVRQAVQQEAASDFSFRRPVEEDVSFGLHTPRITAASQSVDRRTAQYGSAFTSDPAMELRQTQNRITSSFGWDTRNNQFLKNAIQRAQVPSTPSQGHASKSRRGRFDASTLHTSSSSPYASSSRLPNVPSSASWASSHVHGPNGTRQNSIVVIDSDDELDDGGLQDEDFAQLDEEEFM